MGWKASCILVSERGPGYLGTMPAHDSERARALIERMGLGTYQSVGPTTFEVGIFPRENLVIGAYEGGAVIGDLRVGDECLETGPGDLTGRVLAAYPEAEVLRVGLHSVVNLWSYAYFVKGSLRRAHGGTGDDGVLLDVGEWMEEERPHFETSVVRDGERFFRMELGGEMQEFELASYGEELVFAVMGRFLGCRPDEVREDLDPMSLPMEAFAPVKAKRTWWPFGSRR